MRNVRILLTVNEQNSEYLHHCESSHVVYDATWRKVVEESSYSK